MDFFLDLTEEKERLEPYIDRAGGAIYMRRPIRDLDCCSEAEMNGILDVIDAARDSGDTVYVHCWGGVGRTGTVVGCWLVRHGLSGEQALRRIKELRDPTPKGWRESPETPSQRRMVRMWKPGK